MGPPDLGLLDEVALTASTYEQMLERIGEVAAPVIGASLCGVMLWEPGPDTLQMLPGSFGASEASTASYRVRTDDLRSNAARVFSTGQWFISNRAHGDPGILQDYVSTFGIEELLSLPLGVGDRRIGVLHFANRDEPFVDADVALAERLGSRIAVAVEHVRRLVLLSQRESLEGMLARVAERIASGSPLDSMLPPAFDELLRITAARSVALSVPGTEPILLHHGPAVPDIERDFLTESATHPRAVEERVSHPRRAGDPGSSMLHVPVVVSDERVGTLSLLRVRAEPLSGDERTALARLADLTALAWATERYQQERAAMARLRERERIADDLHDHVAQILFSSKTALESVLEQEGLEATQQASVTRARNLLARGEEAIREVIAALSHSGVGTLAERLERLVLEIEEQFGIAVHLELPRRGLPAAAEGAPVADLAVKVCREALVNAAKHAGPSRVSVVVQVARSGRLLLIVHDDGIGMASRPSANRHGLIKLRRAVREHGGALRVSRGPLGGTKLTASLAL